MEVRMVVPGMNASTSTRSGDSRAGGLVKDFKIDYGFGIAEYAGWGTTDQSVSVGTYATLPGGELDNIKLEPRRALLNGILKCSTAKDINERRRDLLRVLSPSSYPRGRKGAQPVRIWFICADVVKEIAVHYEGGLDADFKPDNIGHEQVSIRFVADDPNWYEIGNSAQLIYTNGWATSRGVMARLISLPGWTTFGPPSVTGGAGSSITTHAICRSKTNGLVYIGGAWKDFNGTANADGIVSYDVSTGTWAALGTGVGATASYVVYDIVEGPDGSIYACGIFENMGGVGAADYIARWDGTSWNALGTPLTAGIGNSMTAIYAMAFDRNGNLYVVGNFTEIDDVGGASYIAVWDGSSWDAVGLPTWGATSISYILTVATDSQNNVWVGGLFNDIAGTANATYWAKWNGSAWVAVVSSSELNGIVRSILVDEEDNVYATGDFTNAHGVSTADYILMYDGSAVRGLSTGLNNSGYSMVLAPDGVLYVAGFFTSAGGVDTQYAARWNGESFAHLDVNPPGLVQRIAIGRIDAISDRKYDVWLGISDSEPGQIAYYSSGALPYVNNSGTENVYPVLKIKRSSGTTATIETLRNETSGYELFFDYDLRDGETLTVDLDPKAKSIISSFYGKRLDAVLANSDMGQWKLRPGRNDVTCFVDVTGSPTITAWLEWRDTYNGLD